MGHNSHIPQTTDTGAKVDEHPWELAAKWIAAVVSIGAGYWGLIYLWISSRFTGVHSRISSAERVSGKQQDSIDAHSTKIADHENKLGNVDANVRNLKEAFVDHREDVKEMRREVNAKLDRILNGHG